MRRIRTLVLFGVIACVAGCATDYYQVKDPTTGKIYYTEKVSSRGGGGAVEFKDARTGNSVILQNSEVHEINEDQFESGRATSGNVSKPM